MPTKMLFFTEPSQVAFIKDNHPKLLLSHEIISVCPFAALLLKQSKVDVVLASSYLSPEEIQAVEEHAASAINTWYHPFSHLLEHNGINLGSLVSLDNLMFFKQAIGAYRICKKILPSKKPSEVVIFGPPSRPCADGDAFTDRHDVFEATLMWMAERLDIRCITLHKKTRDFINAKQNTTPSQGNTSRIRLKDFLRISNKPLLAAFGYNHDLLFLKPVVEAVDDKRTCQTLMVNIAREFGSGSIEYFLSVQDFLPADWEYPSEMASRLENARKAFESTDYDSQDQFLQNPHLSFQFDHIWQIYFRTAVKYIEIFNNLFVSLQPDIVLSLEPNYFLYRLFILCARQAEILSACMPHGHMITYPHYLDFDSDIFLCSGKIMQRTLEEKLDKPSHQIKVVGDIRLARQKKNFRRTSLQTGRKVIFLPSQRYVNFTLNQMDLDKYVLAWEILCNYLRDHPNVELLVKPHPTNDYTLWFKQIADSRKLDNLIIIEGQRIEELLQYSDIVLMLGRISNAGLLPPLFDIPMVYLDTTSRAKGYGSFLWTEENGILVIRDNHQLPCTLDLLLNKPEFVKNVTERQKIFLEKFYPGIDSNPEERLNQALTELLNSAN